VAKKDALKEPLLRDDIRPEDVLDESALAEIDEKLAQAEANAPKRLADESAWENAFTPDELRELAKRAGQGERVTLQEP